MNDSPEFVIIFSLFLFGLSLYRLFFVIRGKGSMFRKYRRLAKVVEPKKAALLYGLNLCLMMILSLVLAYYAFKSMGTI